ncbi:hypothetical protein N7465_004248 [Penicillium sp. CMV-2018d]|nr:hypothetical protein N7465_004248 [Penicillium sp. CMV-2018d]
MAIEPKCSAMTLSKGSHENWYSILVGIECMMCTHHVVGPSPTLSHGGYGEMVVERVGERKKRRKREEVEGWREAFYMFTSQVPSQKGRPFAPALFLPLRVTGCSR